MTAWVIFSPSLASASAFSFARIIAEISGGRERLLLAVHFHLHVGVAVRRLHDLVGHAMFFFADFVEFAAHEALDGENGVGGIGDRLAFGRLADESLAVLRERDDRRRRARAFAVFQNDRVAAFHDSHAGVGRAQIDT